MPKPYTDNTQKELDADLGRRVRTATQQIPAAKPNGGNGMLTWKSLLPILVPVLIVIAGLGGSAVLIGNAAADDAAEAKTAADKLADKKMNSDLAAQMFYPREKGTKLEGEINTINVKLNLLLDHFDIEKPKPE